MGKVDGLIIPRSYNDYFSRSNPQDIQDLVAEYTDDALSGTSENPVQNKVVKAAIDAKGAEITALEALVPSQATAQNQLADKSFVNSSIGTNTANYISDNGQPFASVAALEAYTGTVTNNDYAFVTGTDSAGNVYYDRYKATVSGASVSWAKEYRLNNSSFTAEQWAAINSGITAQIVALITNQFDIVYPVGVTYTQYPGQKSPMELWGNYSTWEVVNYAGAFFRAEGGNAAIFGASLTIASQNGATITFTAAHGLTVGSVIYDPVHNEGRVITSVSTTTSVVVNAAFSHSNLTNVLITQNSQNLSHTHTMGNQSANPTFSGSHTHRHKVGALNVNTSASDVVPPHYVNGNTKCIGLGGPATSSYNSASYISYYDTCSSAGTSKSLIEDTTVTISGTTQGNHTHTINASGNTESRPIDFTVKVWVRTA